MGFQVFKILYLELSSARLRADDSQQPWRLSQNNTAVHDQGVRVSWN